MKLTARRNWLLGGFFNLLLISLLLFAGSFYGVPVKADGSPTHTRLSEVFAVIPFGNTVDLIATVTCDTDTPTGSVDFFDNGTYLGTESLVGGVAVLSYFKLVPDAHKITASYSGGGNCDPSTSDPIWVNVMLKATLTTLTIDPESTIPGQMVTLTTITTPDSPGHITPSGSMNFTIEGDQLTRNLTATLDDSGTATVSLSDLPAGSYSAIAYYAPNIGYFSSNSTELVFHVNATWPTSGVGGEVQGVNKQGILALWILLVSVLIIVVVSLALRRRRAG
jgi:hypothetical protein